MRQGRIEQLGQPEELYERPTTEFVAGFLGVSNLLDGEVLETTGDEVAVRLTDGATVRVPAASVNGSRQVRVGIRPEKLRVRARESDTAIEAGLNSLDGTILDASYIGVHTQYLVETTDGHKITVYAQNLETSGASEALGDGEAIRLSWKPQHTFVIDRPAGGANATDLEEEPTP
jgi:spermidine/putrescine transport system ATP-binding protein